ncbi:hypothetical protein XENOCAPTIV_014876 [Xenoophorus captivus]|uniref:UHRF1 tandem tudor domain-containing protein n=1 Tax=Xenoophorus captivus TaxID=1517983 RepID=A0ABV0R2M7_9TELE
MEDGLTLFDYNVGLNDIVQLLIRSQTDPPDSPATRDSSGVASSSAPLPDSKSENLRAPVSSANVETSSGMDIKKESSRATVNETKPDTVATSTKNGFRSSSPAQDTQPPTSSRSILISPGIGLYKINELVDCRDVSIGAWFEACIENVTLSPKGQITPTKGKVGRPPKRTNGKLEAEQAQAHGQGPTTDSNRNNPVLNSESNGASTSQTDSTTETKEKEEDVAYHIKYEE